MHSLIDYFTNRKLTNLALTRYQQFAIERDWRIGGPDGKLRLYHLGHIAFDQGSPLPAAESAFREAYEIVRSWPGVQRGGSLAASDDVFSAIWLGAGNLIGGAVSLADITHPSLDSQTVERFLPALAFVKPTKRYPWMPVSKILHFCNPRLFPIWDWDIVWYRVMWEDAPFRGEYNAFCRERGLKPTTDEPVFLLYYYLWAASYIQSAAEDFMVWFADWMDRHYHADLVSTQTDRQVSTLYATAFEFVAIGAAHLPHESKAFALISQTAD